MKRMLKITGVVAVVLVILVVAALVAAKLLITPERVRTTVLPMAEKSLSRDVAIGDISISIFSGISIKDFRVKMRQEDETFISAESLDLSYKLWPLVRKQVVIDEMRLKKPEIQVVRNADGTFNFSDLIEENTPEADESAKASVAFAQDNKQGPAIDLMVSRARITEGEIRFTDRMQSEEPFSYKITRVDASADNLSLKNSFPFEIGGNLDQAPVSISGTADPAGKKVKADVMLSDLNIADFRTYFKDAVPADLSSAIIDLDVAVEADPNQAASSGKITARGLEMVLEAMPDAAFKDAQVSVDHDLTAELGPETLNVRKAAFDLNGILFEASGTVSDYGSTPVLDISGEMPETEAKKIMAALPRELAEDAADMNPAGSIGAQIKLSGAADRPERLIENGKMRLDRAGVSAEGLDASLNGNIDLSADRISSKELELKLGEDTAFMDFEVTDLFSDPIRVTSSMEAETLDLDYLIGAAGAAGGKRGGEGKKNTEDGRESEGSGREKTGQTEGSIGPVDLPVHARGSVAVKQARYRELPVNDLLIEYSLVDNIFTMEKFSGRVAGGEAKADASVNLGEKDMEYKGNIAMSSVDSGEIISVLYPKYSGMVSGTADLDGQFSGKGILMDDIRKTLSASSEYQLSDGSISGGDLTRQFASLGGTGELESLDFDMFSGNLKIDSGKVKIDGDYDSKDVKMKPSGTIGMDGSVDVNLNLRLAPGMSGSVSGDSLIGRVLGDSEGWTQVPVAVSGSVSDPKLSVDRSGLRKKLREKGTEKVLEEGFKKLFD
ncbi:MAG: AsmA family protein [Desulfobacterales bacterium]